MFSLKMPSRRLCVLFGLVLVALLVACLVYFYKTIKTARQQAYRAACSGHCTCLGHMLWDYEEKHGHFPAAHVDAPNGDRMHSWRAALAAEVHPHRDDFHYDFSKPWNSPENLKMADRRFNNFVCPSDPDAKKDKRLTNYFVIEGEDTPFPGSHTTSIIAKSEDVRNHGGGTILMTEAAKLNIQWLEPRDLEYDKMSYKVNDPNRPSISSHHPGGANACMLNGSVRFLSDQTSPEVLKQMLRAKKGMLRRN